MPSFWALLAPRRRLGPRGVCVRDEPPAHDSRVAGETDSTNGWAESDRDAFPTRPEGRGSRNPRFPSRVTFKPCPTIRLGVAPVGLARASGTPELALATIVP